MLRRWIRKLMRHRKPIVPSYWWVASPKYEALPPLVDDPNWELRINRHNISEQRVPANVNS
jgi:hypothetical protein